SLSGTPLAFGGRPPPRRLRRRRRRCGRAGPSPDDGVSVCAEKEPEPCVEKGSSDMNSQTARRADTMSGRESTIVSELKSKGREIVRPGKRPFWPYFGGAGSTRTGRGLWRGR